MFPMTLAAPLAVMFKFPPHAVFPEMLTVSPVTFKFPLELEFNVTEALPRAPEFMVIDEPVD